LRPPVVVPPPRLEAWVLHVVHYVPGCEAWLLFTSHNYHCCNSSRWFCIMCMVC
jgi:hypothetical protein